MDKREFPEALGHEADLEGKDLSLSYLGCQQCRAVSRFLWVSAPHPDDIPPRNTPTVRIAGMRCWFAKSHVQKHSPKIGWLCWAGQMTGGGLLIVNGASEEQRPFNETSYLGRNRSKKFCPEGPFLILWYAGEYFPQAGLDNALRKGLFLLQVISSFYLCGGAEISKKNLTGKHRIFKRNRTVYTFGFVWWHIWNCGVSFCCAWDCA